MANKLVAYCWGVLVLRKSGKMHLSALTFMEKEAARTFADAARRLPSVKRARAIRLVATPKVEP